MDGGRTWTPPSIIQPNYSDTFNTATQTTQTASGRLIVTWYSERFANGGFGPRTTTRSSTRSRTMTA